MNDIPSRPHVQGSAHSLSLRSSEQPLTGAAGLLALRSLWDRLELGAWLDRRCSEVPGRFRPSLMVEMWVALLFYGGGWMADLEWFGRRGVRRLFGWEALPVPSTFGRWLRRAGRPVAEVLDEAIRRIVRLRWARRGVPSSVTLVLDSTVLLRYGTQQAGAEIGYNPKKPGRPSHHPIVAFLVETGDLIGLRWRPGSAWTAEGAQEWLPKLVGWLREQGVAEITVRLDKGFHAKRVVRALQELEVRYLLKMPAGTHVQGALGTWRESRRARGIFEEAETVHTNSGRLWGDRLLALKGIRRVNTEAEGGMDLETVEVVQSAYLLTNIAGIHSLTAWRAYNQGAVVEQRIEELKQLSAGRTAVDDLGGNHLLWALAGLAYQLLHTLRCQLPTPWQRAQPKRLRTWLFHTPARFTRTSRYWRVHLAEEELHHGLLPRALEALAGSGLRGPPARAA